MLMTPDEDRPPFRGQEQEHQSRQPSRERPPSGEIPVEQRPPSRGELKASADFEDAYSEAFDDVPSYAADDDFSGGERMDNKIKDEVTEIFEVEQPLRESVSERDETIPEVPIFPDPPADALLKTNPEKEDAYEDDDFEDED